MGILSVILHAVQQEGVKVVAAEIQSLRLTAVPGVVLGFVVADAQAGAKGSQDLVLLGCHVVFCGEFSIALIVVTPAAQDHGAAILVEINQRVDFFLGIGRIRIAQRGAVSAAGRGEDERLVLRVGAGGNQIFAGLQLDRAHGVARGQLAEVAHRILIVARHILVVVRSIDADIYQLVSIQDIELNILREGILLAVLLDHSRHGDGHDLGNVGRVLEVHCQRAGSRDGIAGRIGAENGFAALDGVGHGLDGRVGHLGVKERGGERQLLAGDGSRRAALDGGDTQLQRFADPDRRSHSQIAVTLGDADIVVAVVGVKRNREIAGGKLSGVAPGVGDLAGVDNDLNLGDGVS